MTLLEKDIEYIRLNDKRAKMDIYEVNGTKITVDNSETLFEEKYRPRRLFDLIISNSILAQLQNYVDNKTLPNLLMYSQKGGSGKSSISQVLMNETKWESFTFSANASGGIQAIRDNVIGFARRVSRLGDPKLICIEEIGDASAVQVDLFKTICDMYGKTNRLIMTTNSMNRISQPLKTRFTVLDFNKVSLADQNDIFYKIFNRVKAILTIENIEYNDSDIATFMKKYEFSYRELIHAIGDSITDNRLSVDSLINKNISSLSDVINLINKKDIPTLAKIAGGINHIQILEELKDNYLDMINDEMMIQPLIIHINSFQRDIASGLAFMDIAFMDFLIMIVKDGINFKYM